MSAEALELARQHLDARFQHFGACLGLGDLARLLRQRLVGEGQRDVVGDAQRERAVFLVVGERLAREEGDAAHRPVLGADRHAQGRTDALGRDEADPGRARPDEVEERFGGVARRRPHTQGLFALRFEIVGQQVVPVGVERFRRIAEAVLRHLAQTLVGGELQPHSAAVGREEREGEHVVRHDLLNDRGESEEDLADVESLGERRQERLELLATKLPPMLEAP